MKIKIIDGALESLNLLLFLKEEPFLTSSVIYKRFKEIKQGTIYNRLETFIEQGLVEKLDKKKEGKKVLPGGDKLEYKLTIRGLMERKRLVAKNLRVLNSFKELKVSK